MKDLLAQAAELLFLSALVFGPLTVSRVLADDNIAAPESIESIKTKYSSCRVEWIACAHMFEVDCNSAADGPLYYVDERTQEIVSTCGGACMRAIGARRTECETRCPPPQVKECRSP